MKNLSKKQKKNLQEIIIAAVLFILLEILSHIEPVMKFIKYDWIMLILFLIPYFIVGFPVLKKAVLGIYNKQLLDEAFLMVIATIGAFVTGEFAEAVAVMLFYQVGEFFQQYAVKKSRKSIKDLMDIAPENAFVEHEDGTITEEFPDDVNVGDTLVIKPGEKIPVDGVVINGSGMINTSALTGESVPRSVHEGDSIISGCVNGETLLKVRAVKKYEDSTVAKILELVENASEKKSVTENFITRFAHYYTPIVVISAVLLAVIPPIFLGNFLTWIYRACTFLVISCPCALVISVPLSFFGGIGAASKNGVLVKGSNFLEQMAMLETLVTDKTGTLTKGEFKVNEIVVANNSADSKTKDSTNPKTNNSTKANNKQTSTTSSENLIISLAAAAEQMSSHPIALSIKEKYAETFGNKAFLKVSNSENISGKGIYSEIIADDELAKNLNSFGVDANGTIKLFVGNDSLISSNCKDPKLLEKLVASDNASTEVHVALENIYLGCIFISDALKAEAKEAIQKIKDCGVKNLCMLTGDRKNVALAISEELKLDSVYYELLPEDKVNKVEELLESVEDGRKLGFIGDGINDAPVLSRADVGIAMGGIGSDAAIEAADIVIMDDNLLHIPDVIKIAKKTVDISKQNIVFALFVKILVLILGALGLANMWAAVFADVGVAVLCILNAMRAQKFK